MNKWKMRLPMPVSLSVFRPPVRPVSADFGWFIPSLMFRLTPEAFLSSKQQHGRYRIHHP
jgi:hypothetical protein